MLTGYVMTWGIFCTVYREVPKYNVLCLFSKIFFSEEVIKSTDLLFSTFSWKICIFFFDIVYILVTRSFAKRLHYVFRVKMTVSLARNVCIIDQKWTLNHILARFKVMLSMHKNGRTVSGSYTSFTCYKNFIVKYISWKCCSGGWPVCGNQYC